MKNILLLTLSLTGIPLIAQAQTVVPDTSLPNNSVVNTVNDVNTITGGTTAGNNLFHSFEQFSLPTGSEAFFDNAETISNILSRVTGGNISNIDGVIRANGDANLFLLNPNGIVLGSEAGLNIGGMFNAIAGESITFQDGEYSAISPGNSTLSINLPLGVQLGQAPGAIKVEGAGSGLFINDFFEADFSNKTIGLSNSSLTFVAGEIILDGGNITATEGEINLTAATGEVNFNDNNHDLTNATSLGNVDLSNEASIDVSSINGAEVISIDSENATVVSKPGGEININAANLDLADGSAILAINENSATNSEININTTESLTLTGESEFEIFPTFISVDTGIDATQNGGTINLETNDLNIDAGAVISASTFGSGNGGTINIDANDVEIASGGSFASSIIVESSGAGDGGILNLQSDRLYVGLGGSIGGTNFGSGKGATLNIEATDIVFADAEIVDDEVFAPLILADNLEEGSGGTINIQSSNLTVADSAQVSVSTSGTGDGGEININTTNLNLTNSDPNEVTGILSASGLDLTDEELGNAGDIKITSDNINVDNNALISARTLSAGDGGNVTVNSDNLTVSNGAVINSLARGSGNGGAVEINTNELSLREGGQITTGTDDAGQGGNLTIDANQIEISGVADEGNSGILTTGLIGTGNSGNIEINTNSLDLNNGGTISASNFSTENAELAPGLGMPGTVEINANQINIQENSGNATGISTSVNSQSGGEIKINSTENLNVTGNNARITAESLGAGDGGDINLTTNDINLEKFGSVSVSASATGNAGNITITGENLDSNQGQILAESQISGGGDISLTTNDIKLNSDSLISTSVAQSDGGGGNLTINNQETILLRNNSDLRANAFNGPGGNIEIATKILLQNLTSDIDASSRSGLDGSVTINTIESDEELTTTVLPDTIQDPTAMIAGTCPVADENSFAFVGNGGIPNTPADAANVQATWNDLRLIEEEEKSTPVNTAKAKPIYEGDRLIADSSGEIYLIANQRINNDRWTKSDCK